MTKYTNLFFGNALVFPANFTPRKGSTLAASLLGLIVVFSLPAISKENDQQVKLTKRVN